MQVGPTVPASCYRDQLHLVAAQLAFLENSTILKIDLEPYLSLISLVQVVNVLPCWWSVLMTSDTPRSSARGGTIPLHAMLAPITAVCFAETLVADIVYWRSATMMWADMSTWLLTAGLVVGLFAVITGLVAFFGNANIRRLRAAWIYGFSGAAVMILSLFNIFVHSRDAYTSVVPTGIVLSTLVVLILLVSAWSGWDMVYRDGVGVRLENRR